MDSAAVEAKEFQSGFERAIILICLVATIVLTVGAAAIRILPGDLATTRAIQELAIPGADDVTHAVNWVGLGLHLTLVALPLAIGLAFAGKRGAAVVIVATQLARVLNPLLKAVVDSPRPSADLVRIAEQAPGSGFPSGHAMSAVLFYGGVAYVALEAIDRPSLRAVVQVVAVAAIALAGFSRIYVGAHWLTDVVGGYLWGALLLFAIIHLQRRFYP